MITTQTLRIKDTDQRSWTIKTGRAKHGWLYEVYVNGWHLPVSFGYLGTADVSEFLLEDLLRQIVKTFRQTPLVSAGEIGNTSPQANKITALVDGVHVYAPLPLEEISEHIKFLSRYKHTEEPEKLLGDKETSEKPKQDLEYTPPLERDKVLFIGAHQVVSPKECCAKHEMRMRPMDDGRCPLCISEHEDGDSVNEVDSPWESVSQKEGKGIAHSLHEGDGEENEDKSEMDLIRERLLRKIQDADTPSFGSLMKYEDIIEHPIEAGEVITSIKTGISYLIMEVREGSNRIMGCATEKPEKVVICACLASLSEEERNSYSMFGIEKVFWDQATKYDWKDLRFTAALHYDSILSNGSENDERQADQD